MKTSYQSSQAGWLVATTVSALMLASAVASASVIFQADFKGPGGGTGGSNDLVTLGGTGAIMADGVNLAASITNAYPFAPGAGNYLEVQRLTTSGGGQYSPVLFTFASNSNSWDAWQGPNITDPVTGAPDIVVHGALDFFFRVNTNAGTGINDMFSIRTLDQFSWSDGGDGMSLRFNGQRGGSMILQIQNAGWTATPPDNAQNAIVNVTTSGGNVAYYQQYDDIDMNMLLPNGAVMTNGIVYHAAVSFSTDTNGLITAAVYLVEGTGAIDPVNDVTGWATFNLVATNILDWSEASTPTLWTNQPWNFGVGWAADGGPFIADYGAVRIYNSAPASFTALPAPLKFFPPVLSQGQIILSWSGSGRLQWAPTVRGPWTFVTPAPSSPYSASAQGNRFFRLVGQ
ncbi:exported hypothetical protein [Verrucomicrobia bacterium]|nr:exported hypothetical protein [Verrucomicrobiota bacterium]